MSAICGCHLAQCLNCVQMLNGGQQAGGARNGIESREKILQVAKEQRDKFDQEMKQLEEEALKDFKEGIRKAVAASTVP